MKKISLKKNFGWAFVGNIINAAGQWVMLSALAKICSVEVVGLFGLAMAVSTPIVSFTNLQLSLVYVTDVNDQYKFSEYLALRLLTIIFAFILVLSVGIYNEYKLYVIMLIAFWCLAQCVVSLKDFYQGVMQRYERMDISSHSKTLQSVLSVISFVGFLYFTKELLWSIIAVLLVRVFVLVFVDIRYAKKLLLYHSKCNSVRFLPEYDFSRQIALLKLTIPLGIVIGMVSLNANMPRYQLEKYHDEAALGYFTALSSFIVIGNMLVLAISQSLAPRLAVYYKENIKAFGKTLVKMFFMGLTIGLLGIVVSGTIGDKLLAVFFTQDYAKYHNVLVMVMLAATPYYISSFLNNGLMAARRLSIQVPLNLLSLLTVWLAGYLYIPKYGQMGAALAIFCGAMVTMIGTIFLNIVEYRKKIIVEGVLCI